MNTDQKWKEIGFEKASIQYKQDILDGTFNKDIFDRLCHNVYDLTDGEIYMVEKGANGDFEKLIENNVNALKRKEAKQKQKEAYKVELSKFADIPLNDYGDLHTAIVVARNYNDTIEEYKHKSLDRNVLLDMANNLASDIKNLYVKGAKAYIKEAEEWQDKYAKVWKQQDYQDPQQELLKRQDLDTRLSAMNEKDLKDYIDSNKFAYDDLDEYGINKLLSAVKDDASLYSKVKSYKDGNHIGSEYEKSEDWQKVDENLSMAKRYQYLGEQTDHIQAYFGLAEDGVTPDSRNFFFYPLSAGKKAIGQKYDIIRPTQREKYFNDKNHDRNSKIKIPEELETKDD